MNYINRRHNLSTGQLQKQLDWLENNKAQRIAARALGLRADSGMGEIMRTARERISFGLWVQRAIENQFDYDDQKDTERSAVA